MKRLTFGVREFQANLGLALRTASQGGRVTITSRKRPIATLGPPERPGRERSPEDVLDRLIAEGKAKAGYIGPMPCGPLKGKFLNLGAQVAADRE